MAELLSEDHRIELTDNREGELPDSFFVSILLNKKD
jgi:hypothetical protein